MASFTTCELHACIFNDSLMMWKFVTYSFLALPLGPCNWKDSNKNSKKAKYIWRMSLQCRQW